MTTILVTGAPGFTGARTLPLLLANGYQLRCLVRPTSDRRHLAPFADQFTWANGDIGDEYSLRTALDGCDILVNLASLGFGHAPTLVKAAQAATIARAIFLSTTAIFTTLNAASKTTRLAAEAAIAASGLPYTILRPTMIYGGARDRNMSRLTRYLQRWPFLPIVGSGEALQQPVHVDDIATAITQVLAHPATIGNAYNLPGAAPLTYNAVITTITNLLRRRVRRLHLPLRPITALLRTIERTPLRLPLKAEQIARLNEDKTFDYTPAHHAFNYTPRPSATGIAQELHELGLLT